MIPGISVAHTRDCSRRKQPAWDWFYPDQILLRIKGWRSVGNGLKKNDFSYYLNINNKKSMIAKKFDYNKYYYHIQPEL